MLVSNHFRYKGMLFVISLAIFGCISGCGDKQPGYVWDFRNDPDLSDIGLAHKMSEERGILLLPESGDVLIEFPSDRIFHEFTRELYVNKANDNTIEHMVIKMPYMKRERAHRLARKLHHDFGIQTDRLDVWREKTFQGSRVTYEFYNNQEFPSYGVEIRYRRRLKMWSVSLNITWINKNGSPTE